ncbi:hypothetical protein Tco_0373423, partial [Tanacetum coccineum]
MYKEYLAEFWYSSKALENSKVSFFVPTGGIYGEVRVNTFRNAIGAHYLPHSSEYVAPSSIDIVRPWFEIISSKATKGGSSKRPTGSKTGHLKRKKESSLAMDSNPNQTSASTPVVAEIHKEDQQATGGPTSLGITSKARSNPQLSSGMSAFNLNEPIYSSSFIIHSESASRNDASAVSIAEADPKKSAPGDFIPQQQGMNNTSYDHLFAVEEDETSRTIKLQDLSRLESSVQPSFKDLDSPKDDPIIVVDDSDEDEEANEVHATRNAKTEDTSVPKSSSPSSLPTELKELPSKFNELTEEVKGLKKQVHDLEIELPGELKKIPTKLENFTKTVTSLTSQVAELKTLQWELPAEFLSVPTQIEVIQAKLKTLDALPSLLHKVTNALNQFAQAIASKKTKDDSVPLVGQASTHPAEGEKNTNQATISQLFKRKATKNANL